VDSWPFYFGEENMEKLKIIVDDKGTPTVWLDGKELHGMTKIKLECEVNSLPVFEVQFLPSIVNLGGKHE
jgi:hypothetical protein